MTESPTRSPLLETAVTLLIPSLILMQLSKPEHLGAAGSAAFNEELGRLTLLSYPMIALPATLMMLAVLYYLAVGVKRLAGLSLSDALHNK